MTNVMRGIPRIKHTPELEAACVALTKEAKDGKGQLVNLGNPFNLKEVRARMTEINGWFVDPSFYFGEAGTELAAVSNLVLLATVLREHLKAGNSDDS